MGGPRGQASLVRLCGQCYHNVVRALCSNTAKVLPASYAQSLGKEAPELSKEVLETFFDEIDLVGPENDDHASLQKRRTAGQHLSRRSRVGMGEPDGT